jgi:hypothetical protein
MVMRASVKGNESESERKDVKVVNGMYVMKKGRNLMSNDEANLLAV